MKLTRSAKEGLCSASGQQHLLIREYLAGAENTTLIVTSCYAAYISSVQAPLTGFSKCSPMSS